MFNKETKKQIMSDLNISQDLIKSSKLINPGNTVKIILKDGTEIIRYHHTNIVTKNPDNTYILNSGGWKTKTTKSKINEHAPINMWQEKGVWYFNGICFYDGIKINSEGKLLSKKIDVDLKKLAKKKAKIKKFSQLVFKDMPLPSGGDCWICKFNPSKQCLESHIKENYLHGTLIYNALKKAGHNDQSVGYYYHSEDLRDRVQQYVYK